MMDHDTPSKAFVASSPQGLAIRDPGVLTSSQSFTQTDFENRHTVDSGIGMLIITYWLSHRTASNELVISSRADLDLLLAQVHFVSANLPAEKFSTRH